MDPGNPYYELCKQSYNLSRSFWISYEQHIKPVAFAFTAKTDNVSGFRDNEISDREISIIDHSIDEVPQQVQIKDETENINAEYLEFIRITREHQLKRDRLKKLELAKNPEIETYYQDISLVNTLVEDNLVEVPDRNADLVSKSKLKEQKLVEMYGGRENYERIRSMEMAIDEHFNKKYKELSPKYWPAMPLNPKLYLNPILLD